MVDTAPEPEEPKEHRFRSQVVQGSIWSVGATIGRTALILGFNILLARLLTPADFGVLAMALVVVDLAVNLGPTGTTAALVQRADAGERHFSTGFWLGTFSGFATWAAVSAAAPWAVAFYHEPLLASLLPVLALQFLIGALGSVPRALLLRDLRYVTLSRIDLTVTIMSGFLGVTAALSKQDARTSVQHADCIVTNLPYGTFSHLPENGIDDVLANLKGLATRVTLVTNEDLRGALLAHGYTLDAVIDVEPERFKRFVFLTRSPAPPTDAPETAKRRPLQSAQRPARLSLGGGGRPHVEHLDFEVQGGAGMLGAPSPQREVAAASGAYSTGGRWGALASTTAVRSLVYAAIAWSQALVYSRS